MTSSSITPGHVSTMALTSCPAVLKALTTEKSQLSSAIEFKIMNLDESSFFTGHAAPNFVLAWSKLCQGRRDYARNPFYSHQINIE
jgi:hypothetical protein